MNPIDREIEAVSAVLRAQGAVVGIDPAAPDYVKRAWLQALLECPDYRKAIMGRHHGTAN